MAISDAILDFSKLFRLRLLLLLEYHLGVPRPSKCNKFGFICILLGYALNVIFHKICRFAQNFDFSETSLDLNRNTPMCDDYTEYLTSDMKYA